MAMGNWDKAQPKGWNSLEDFLEEGAEQVGNPEAEGSRTREGAATRPEEAARAQGAKGMGSDPPNTCVACPWHSEY